MFTTPFNKSIMDALMIFLLPLESVTFVLQVVLQQRQQGSRIVLSTIRSYFFCSGREFWAWWSKDSAVRKHASCSFTSLQTLCVFIFPERPPTSFVDPHPHELHAVVQRRLSAKQKQEVLLLRQQHGGQLEKEHLHPTEEPHRGHKLKYLHIRRLKRRNSSEEKLIVPVVSADVRQPWRRAPTWIFLSVSWFCPQWSPPSEKQHGHLKLMLI